MLQACVDIYYTGRAAACQVEISGREKSGATAVGPRAARGCYCAMKV